VPLVPELREALGRARTADLDAAVTSGRRKPWTDGSLTNAFRRARDRAGLRGWRLHDLRHFYVTSLFRAGLPAPLVQRLAGHEHLVTTQRYAHLVELDLAGVSGALDRVVRGNSGETES
jgi:integrase